MMPISRFASIAVTGAQALLASAPLRAQERDLPPVLTVETFTVPPDTIAQAVLAPRWENRSPDHPSPNGRYLVNEVSGGLPTQADHAKPFYRLAGQVIDPRGNRDRAITTRGDVGLEIVEVATGTVTPVQVPRGARVSAPQWSPDGAHLGFLAHTEDASHVYVAEAATGRSRQVTRTPVLATLNTSFAWTGDSRSIVTVLVPDGRGRAPQPAAVPNGPQVRHTTPGTNRLRTYRDLLEDPYEHDLLAFYNTGQLAVVTVQNRRVRLVGTPAMIEEVDVSPDGAYAIVTTMQRPFSYTVPARSFPERQEVWSLETGRVLTVLRDRAVRDGSTGDTTNGARDPEVRDAAWRPDGQGLGFLQALPRRSDDSVSGDASPAGIRGAGGQGDRVMQWLPPFDSTTLREVYRSTARLAGVRYAPDAQMLFLVERSGDTTHEYAVLLSDPTVQHTLFRGRRRTSDRSDAGSDLLTVTLPNGTSAVRVSAPHGAVYLSGVSYADDPAVDGPTSYVDRVTIVGGEHARVFESTNDGVWEQFAAALDDAMTQVVLRRESPTQVPDTYVRDLITGAERALTHNVDHTPDLTRAQRRRYEVGRVDGFKLALDVTLPGQWQPGERLPGLLWFYPREYEDQGDYDESRESWNKNAFPRIETRSKDILVRLGYAVIEPDAPIVGPTGRMNDNYVNDLRNNLAAVIDFLDAEGVIDRRRLGVGGRSYGGFATANALVHTPFFRAGIAGYGNYNRTLTPFSFQNEDRSLWEAQDTYLAMSPLLQADHLSGALLLYHGAEDQNDGTFPINSWRMFEALEALGKTATLVVYPGEEHSPATQETILDLWARWTAWLDRYVKNAGEPAEEATLGG